MSGAITRHQLRDRVAGWLAEGAKVFGPVRVSPDRVLFAPLGSPDELLLDGWVRPANSIKEAVFPRHETLYGYRVEGNRIELTEPPAAPARQIVIGAHPCDAAAFPILDKIFNWDFRDEFYNRRRDATTVISLACSSHDDQCFCTSAGLGPDSGRGSDVLLTETADGTFAIRALTDRGRELLPGDAEELVPAGPERRFDPAGVAAFARSRFDDPFWDAHSLACVGCGACAYTCPVCHCFDIVDEGNGREGIRARNWDACQFPLFTLHASGHNPRGAQGDRQRQRLYHKFVVYPEKFGDLLCTGCGNCARNCPEGLGVLPLAMAISHG
jgi:ferredoxin